MDARPINPAPSHVRLTAGVLAEFSRRLLRLDDAELARLGLSRPVLDAAVHGARYDDDGGRDAMRRVSEALDRSAVAASSAETSPRVAALEIVAEVAGARHERINWPVAVRDFLASGDPRGLDVLAALLGTQPSELLTVADLATRFGVRIHDGEICNECGGAVDLVWWCHDDLLWEVVTGKIKPVGSRESAGGILCIQCFDRKAREVCPWIEWAPVNLRHLLDKDVQERAAAKRHELAEG